MTILVSKLFLQWEHAPALSQGRTLFLLMLVRARRRCCLYWCVSPGWFLESFCKGLKCLVLLEHLALSAWLCWGPWYFYAGLLVPLQLSAAIVLSVLLCESYVLTPQDIETSIVTVWWRQRWLDQTFILDLFRFSYELLEESAVRLGWMSFRKQCCAVAGFTCVKGLGKIT